MHRSAARRATSSNPAACWDRQTDGRTDTVPFHRPGSAYYVSNASNAIVDIRLGPVLH